MVHTNIPPNTPLPYGNLNRSPYDNLHFATWNACGLKAFKNKELGLYYIKNITQLAKHIKGGFIFSIQETRLTQIAQRVIQKKWNSFFTTQRDTGLGLGFIYSLELQNPVFMLYVSIFERFTHQRRNSADMVW